MRKYLHVLLTLLTLVFFIGNISLLKAQRVTIIESLSSEYWGVMDTVWRSVAEGEGYTATIVQQSALNSLDSLTNTDVLVVAASQTYFNGTDHLQTIVDFMQSGRPVYIQSEYESTFQGNVTFTTLMDTAGENFSWTGIVAGQLVPMTILPPFSLYPDSINAIYYFNYGQSGTPGGHIDSFLQYGSNYFGFYYHDSLSCNGAVITCSDEDWIWMNRCPQVMTNILYRLVHSANCHTQAVTFLQGSASVNYAQCSTACSASASVTAQYGTPPYHYLWLPNNDTTANVNNLCNGLYTVQVSDNGGDTVVDSVLIAIPPASVLTIAAADTIFCPGDSAMICAAAGFSSYQWNFGQPSTCIQAYTAGDYFASALDSNSCAVTSNHVAITVYSVPPLTISAPDTVFCPGDSTMICALPGFSSYVWNSGQTSSCIGAYESGDYYTSAFDSNNCPVLSNRLSITVYPSPPLSLNATGDTLKAFGAVSYRWFMNGNLIKDDTFDIYIATAAGNYSVEITDSNGCTITSNQVVITGINKLLPDNLIISPNPTYSDWQISGFEPSKNCRIEIYDAAGKLVYETPVNSEKMSISLDVAAGTYMMNIVTAEGIVTRKLIRL